VLVLAALAAGCNKDKAAAAPAADKTAAAPAAAKVAAAPAPAATPASGSAADACVQLGDVVKQKVPASHAADTSEIVECMVDLCHSDKWSADVITCIEGSPFDATQCQSKLSADQFKHLDTSIKAEFGSDGGGAPR
jgi:hypothetical protein